MIFEHRPVLVKECLSFLQPKSRGIYVDCTLGLGGHSEKILEVCGEGAKVVGIELDKEAIEVAESRLNKFGSSLKIIRGSFADLGEILNSIRIEYVDGILLDLGVSSFQLENSKRGFSFLNDGPLDMRMDRREVRTAATLVGGLGERELARIFRDFGEERLAKRIARAIVKVRERGNGFERTLELAELVGCIYGRRKYGIHPATRVFQALRIAVNDELNNLKKILGIFDKYLRQGGRIVVISFHSLEDRIVKHALLGKAKEGRIKILTKKPITPSENEMLENPRSRSAKLRVAEML